MASTAYTGAVVSVVDCTKPVRNNSVVFEEEEKHTVVGFIYIEQLSRVSCFSWSLVARHENTKHATVHADLRDT